MDWIRFFHNPKLVIKTMIHPIKNKKITNAMHIQVSMNIYWKNILNALVRVLL